jgi:phospholipid/cholesterol/gamma-HCH transport system ATP-binding protein
LSPTEIRVEGLHKAFGTNRVLCGIDLEIARGEMVAIVGGSGCGKTVLLHHIIGQIKPDKGRILVADHETPGDPLVDVTRLAPEEMDRIRLHSAVVFQRNALFSGTVYENIALWPREIRRLGEEEIRKRARAALDAVSFAGDETIMDVHRDELSGGMAKRVAVARALAMHPMVIFFDEPTTGLDPTNAASIHDLIHRTHSEKARDGGARTTVIVTHDKDLLRRLRPRVVMLHDGRIFFDGSHREFERSDSAIIRPYFEAMPALHERGGPGAGGPLGGVPAPR